MVLVGFRDTIRNAFGMKAGGSGVAVDSVEQVSWAAVSEMLGGMTTERLWRTQPHLRTVVSFVARNISQLGLHTFERVSDTDRQRLRDDPMAQLLSQPNGDMTGTELIYSLVADLKLYDVAIWHVTESADTASGWSIRPVPPSWVIGTGGGDAFAPGWVQFVRPGGGKPVTIEAKDLLLFHGWNPGEPRKGASPVEALKDTLREQIHAHAYRQQIWERGGRVGSVITRPADAGTWSDDARTRFARDWASKWTGDDGPKAGGTPILEDGMTLSRLGFSAKEDEWIEGVKLSLATVAQVYHINPTMVGQLDNANFSNVKEFHAMLYNDSLGPDIKMIEDRINTFLVPRVSGRSGVYVEFNVAEKLRGSFEEQMSSLSTSTGRPFMTANESRSKLNLPALEGDAEFLVTPLNVLVGGQASPQDGVTAGGGGESVAAVPAQDDIKLRVDAVAALIRSGFDPAGALAACGLDPILHLGLLPVTVQRPVEPDNVDQEAVDALKTSGVVLRKDRASGAIKVKAQGRAQDETASAEVLARFFKRQRAAVLSSLGSKAPGWWDEARWNDELAEDLYALAMDVTGQVAVETLDALGLEPDAYNVDQTEAFLKAVAESRAGAINSTTRDQIKAALAGEIGEGAEGATPAGVFDVAEGSRSTAAGVTLATTFAAFAVTEVGQQIGRADTTKTWLVESRNPRSSHAAMNGETVSIDDVFSNGMNWPGDPVGGAAEVANCMCSVEITVP